MIERTAITTKRACAKENREVYINSLGTYFDCCSMFGARFRIVSISMTILDFRTSALSEQTPAFHCIESYQRKTEFWARTPRIGVDALRLCDRRGDRARRTRDRAHARSRCRRPPGRRPRRGQDLPRPRDRRGA